MPDFEQGHPRGLTLIEVLLAMLVVGILGAIAVGGVLYARQRAHRLQCVNNQQILGRAVLEYELQCGGFPGWLNPKPPGGNASLNWVEVLLPYMGRPDLWVGDRRTKGWRDGGTPKAALPQLLCPDDREALAATTPENPPLSYVANLEVFPDLSGNIEKKAKPVKPAEPEPRTVMLGERLHAGPWTTSVAGKLTFIPKRGKRVDASLSSHHQGIIVVTFCGGNVEQLRDDDLLP